MITKTNNRTLLAMSGLTYDFDFRIDDATELEVYGITAGGVSTELTTGFSISFDTANEEGTVTFVAEPSTYANILMLRNRAYTQDTDIPIRGGFSEEDIEKALDQIVIQIQQLKEITDYAVKQDITGSAVNITLPTPEDGLALVWDGTSGAMQNAPVDAGAIADAVTAAEAAQAAAEAAAASIDSYASQAQAEAGVAETVVMNPLRTAQAIAALAEGSSFKVKKLTRDLSLASGDVAYTGFGFTPKAVIVLCSDNTNSSSIGIDDGTTCGLVLEYSSTHAEFSDYVALVQKSDGSANYQTAIVKTFDVDGITLTWGSTGTLSGTAALHVLAIG
jgi:hypothetical protein